MLSRSQLLELRQVLEFSLDYDLLADQFLKKNKDRLWAEFDELVARHISNLQKIDSRVDAVTFIAAVRRRWSGTKQS